MAVEGEFPKVDGDVLYASEANNIKYLQNLKFSEGFMYTAIDTNIWAETGTGGGTVTSLDNSRWKGYMDGSSNGVVKLDSDVGYNKASTIICSFRLQTINESSLSTTETFYGCGISDRGAPSSHFAILSHTSGTSWRLSTKDGSTEEDSSPFVVDFSTEKEVKIIIDSSNAKIYIDGVLKATNSTNLPSLTQSLGLRFGFANNTTSVATTVYINKIHMLTEE